MDATKETKSTVSCSNMKITFQQGPPTEEFILARYVKVENKLECEHKMFVLGEKMNGENAEESIRQRLN
jgi:hypothetical protein